MCASRRRTASFAIAGETCPYVSAVNRGSRGSLTPHVGPEELPLPHEAVRFAHNLERQFAKLLDFYAIEWEYEPRTFTLESDHDGNRSRPSRTTSTSRRTTSSWRSPR